MNVLADAINDRLIATSGLTALLAVVPGTASAPAIYHDQAVKEAPLDYVIYSKQGGGPENLDSHNRRDLTYFVRGYSDNAKDAGAIDAQIDAALHNQTLTVTGYRNFWLTREQDFETVETTPDGSKIYMAGAFYRIRIT